MSTEGDVVKFGKNKFFSLFGVQQGSLICRIYYASQVIFDKRKKLTIVFTGANLRPKEN